jgi:hypothetical protein
VEGNEMGYTKVISLEEFDKNVRGTKRGESFTSTSTDGWIRWRDE